MFVEIHPDNPQPRLIKQVIDVLEQGGIIVYPTDTVYGIGCDITSKKAVDKICKLRGLDPVKARLTFMCDDISQVAQYAHQIDNEVFRLMKRNTPGPFTFVLNSSNQVPKMFKNRKRTIGIRIPDNTIAMTLVRELGRPILSTSLKTEDELVEYFTEPYLIQETYGNQVDFIIDGGTGQHEPSTIVDCTGSQPEIVRQGKGVLVD